MKKFLSLLQVKLPILHYRLEGPELLQGVLMIAVGLSTVPVLQETLGMSYSAALTAVAIAEALGLLHVTFGDPVVPGWIASALPLVLVYMANYAVGIEAAHALIALQLIVGLLFVLLGATGLAHKLMTWIPGSLKAGILFGAAVEALGRIFGEGGYLSQYPLSVGAGAVVSRISSSLLRSAKVHARRAPSRGTISWSILYHRMDRLQRGFSPEGAPQGPSAPASRCAPGGGSPGCPPPGRR